MIAEKTGAQNIIICPGAKDGPAWFKSGEEQKSEPRMESNIIYVALSAGGWLIVQGAKKEFDGPLWGQYCSQAIENARKYSRIEEQSLVDDLTGLPNRIALTRKINSEIKRCGIFCVLFIDLNNFKAINDTLGHPVGDKIIRQAGQKIKTAIRSQDFLARYGGDEFVAVLPDTTRDQGGVLAERIKEKAIYVNKSLIVTLSIGMALHPDDGDSVEKLIAQADVMMYRDKRRRTDGQGLCNVSTDSGS